MTKAMAIAMAENESKSFGEKVLSWPARTKRYVQDLQTEMKRVTWPNWKQVRATTVVVIITVFLFAGYFFLIDQVIGRTITKLFDTLTR
jgi:preprotein translocase subunit SecE